MSIRITTLIENTSGEHLGLETEHGISFLIEVNGKSYIFDTGQSGSIVKNAGKMGLDLTKVEKIILSHGHYDHSGGLLPLLDSGAGPSGAELIVHKDFFVPKYGIEGARTEFLGNDFTPEDLRSRGFDIKQISSDLQALGDGIHVVSNFDRTHQQEKINERFVLLKDGVLEVDDFGDEIMLAIETPKGLVLIAGCSHPGIMNMIDTVKKRLGTGIYAVIGGTHLVEADDDYLNAAVEFFNELDCELIGVSHCTGPRAMERLKNDSRFFHNRTGSSLIIS